MLTITFTKRSDPKIPVLVPIFSDDLSANRRKIFRGLSRAQKRAVRSALTKNPLAKSGHIPIFSGDAVVFLSILEKNHKVTTREAREGGEKVFELMRNYGVPELIIAPGSLEKERFFAFQEGVDLGSYEFLEYKGKKKKADEDREKLTHVRFFSEGGKKDSERLAIMAAGLKLTKDIINTPPSDATPEFLSRTAQNLAKGLPQISVSVLLKKELERLNCGGILGVGRGSKYEPRLIVLEYKGGKKDEAPLVLVGKGVTFDTGGNNIKTGDHMRWMKQDLAGGATVLGALYIAARSAYAKNITVLIPAVENVVSRDAYFPDDILRMHNGMTVEVHNTDAEGRLILADALSYAAEKFKPRAIVDAATLTGACLIAVGNDFTAGLANNQRLFNALKRASLAVDEPLWQLPLHERYADMLKSKTADIANCSKGIKAGTIEGGLFLQHFVPAETPWCHLDIASVAFDEKVGGATGRDVRLLAKFAEAY